MTQQGYMHAVEGILAGLLVVFFMSSLVQPPDPEDWSRTSLTKRSGDVVSTLQRSGVLDDAVRDGDVASVRSMVDAIGADMDFSMAVTGIPQRQIEIMLGIHNDSVIIKGEDSPGSNSWSGSIGPVNFEVRDVRSETRFDTIRFDFDGDGNFDGNTPNEGPFTSGDIVDWNWSDSGDRQHIGIGYINDTVTFYNLTDYEELVAHDQFSRGGRSFTPFYLPTILERTRNYSFSGVNPPDVDRPFFDQNVEMNIQSGGTQVSFTEQVNGGTEDIDTKGPFTAGDEVELFGRIYEIQRITGPNGRVELVPRRSLKGDVLYMEDIAPSVIEGPLRGIVETVVSNGGTVVEATNLSHLSSFDGSFHQELGLKKIDQPIRTNDLSASVLHDGEAGTVSERVAEYSREGEIVVPESRLHLMPSSSNPHHGLGIFSLEDKRVFVNVSMVSEEINYFLYEDSSGALQYIYDIPVDSPVFLFNNSYEVIDQYPLRLKTNGEHIYGNRRAGRFDGEETLMKMRDWSWDPNAHNESGFGTDSGRGLPSTSCSNGQESGTFQKSDLPSLPNDIEAMITDVPPCGEWEYINFDITDEAGNGFYGNTSDETGSQTDEEGVYTDGQDLRIDGKLYTVTIGSNGGWAQLKRKPPDQVGAAFWNEDVLETDGNYVYMGNRSLADDDAPFMQSVFIQATREEQELTPEAIIGEPNIGTVTATAVSDRVYSPYLIDSVWWFR